MLQKVLFIIILEEQVIGYLVLHNKIITHLLTEVFLDKYQNGVVVSERLRQTVLAQFVRNESFKALFDFLDKQFLYQLDSLDEETDK